MQMLDLCPINMVYNLLRTMKKRNFRIDHTHRQRSIRCNKSKTFQSKTSKFLRVRIRLYRWMIDLPTQMERNKSGNVISQKWLIWQTRPWTLPSTVIWDMRMGLNKQLMFHQKWINSRTNHWVTKWISSIQFNSQEKSLEIRISTSTRFLKSST